MPGSSTIKNLLSQLAKEFPGIRWTSPRLIETGWDHYVIILDNSHVFRLAKTEEQTGYFSDEIKLLELIGKHTSVSIPEITHISKSKRIIGYPHLPGIQLNREIVSSFDEELLGVVAEQLGRFLGDLHEITLDECRNAGLINDRFQGELKWLRTGFEEQLRDRLTERECKVIENLLTELEACQAACQHKVLLHGDLGLEHVILDREAQQIAIIDFSDWMFGDPAYDFC